MVYFARAPRNISFTWDDLDIIEKIEGEVSPAYISDAKNLKTMETGIKWVDADYGEWDPVKQRNIKPDKKLTRQVPMQNTPITIQIVNLEHRSKGGRAYKVITPEGFYVDLREDVLLDTLRSSTIINGKPDCTYVWGKVGAEMKLVRIGSRLHQELLAANELDKVEKVKPEDLQVGEIWENKAGEKACFLGWVNTKVLTLNPKRREYAKPQIVASISDEKLMAWFTWPWDDPKLNKGFDRIKIEPYYISFKKSISYKTKLGQKQVPENIFERIRRTAKEQTERYIQDTIKRNAEKRDYYTNKKENPKQHLTEYYSQLFMRAVGEPEPKYPTEFTLTVGEEVADRGY